MAINSITELKKQIKENNPDNVYLFYGEERYLMDLYIKRIEDAVGDGGFSDFNRLIVDDIKTSLEDIADFIDTYPMMSEKKVLVIRDTGLFKSANEVAKEFWTSQLSNLPEYIIIIFKEAEINKKSVIYKAIANVGSVIEFKVLSEMDRVTWLERQFLNAKKKIKKENAIYLAEISDEGLETLSNEVNKLINFCDEEITRSDIERVVSKSLNTKVYEMIDAIIEKKPDEAFSILEGIKTVKEPAFRVLYALFSNFEKLLHVQLLLKEGENLETIAKKFKMPTFIARKYMKKTFSESFLAENISKIAEIDLAIKEGRIEEWTAIEQYIAEFLKINS